MDLGLLVVIVVFAVFVPVGIISYLVVLPSLRKRDAASRRTPPPADPGA